MGSHVRYMRGGPMYIYRAGMAMSMPRTLGRCVLPDLELRAVAGAGRAPALFSPVSAGAGRREAALGWLVAGGWGLRMRC